MPPNRKARVTTRYVLAELDDPRDALHHAVQTLVEGGVASLPLENGPVGCVLATSLELDDALVPNAVLLVGSIDAAADWLPDLSTLQARLVTRSWPGAVAFRVPESEWTLAPALPQAVRRQVCNASGLAIRVPRSDVVEDVLALLPAPLIAAEQGEWTERAAVELVDAVPASVTPATEVRLSGAGYEILTEGTVSLRELERNAGMEVVFVCTGNTCRSPMAEAIFVDLAARELDVSPGELAGRGVRARSMGLAAADGMPASGDAVDVALRHGLDLSGHLSTPATLEALSRADAVFTMTQGHRAAILSQAPELAATTQTLIPDGRDISDPIGMGPREYAACFDEIAAAITQRLPNLLDEVTA